MARPSALPHLSQSHKCQHGSCSHRGCRQQRGHRWMGCGGNPGHRTRSTDPHTPQDTCTSQSSWQAHRTTLGGPSPGSRHPGSLGLGKNVHGDELNLMNACITLFLTALFSLNIVYLILLVPFTCSINWFTFICVCSPDLDGCKVGEERD